MSNYMWQSDVLNYAIKNGIINIDDVQNDVINMERKEILKQHQYKIWKASDGRWKTYVFDESKQSKRRLISKGTRTQLDDEIVDEYRKKTASESNVEILFFEWIEYALKCGDIVKGTYDRYVVDYNRFIKNTDFSKRKVRDVTELELSRFLKKAVCGRKEKDKITAKCFSNIKSMIAGLFTYAKIEIEIPCIPIRTTLKDIRFSSKQFKKTIVKDSEQVFNDEETSKIADYIIHYYRSTKDLGILLALTTGVRVGELSTLKVTDQENYRLYIQRTEIKEKDESGKTVVKVREFPKTEGSMEGIELTNSAFNILKLIKRINLENGVKSDYLFWDHTYGRTKSTTFDKRIRRICADIGIPERSMHKLRKTYASLLFDKGVEEKIVQSQMRHKTASTTHNHYEFSVRNREYTRDKLNRADHFNITCS